MEWASKSIGLIWSSLTEMQLVMWIFLFLFITAIGIILNQLLWVGMKKVIIFYVVTFVGTSVMWIINGFVKKQDYEIVLRDIVFLLVIEIISFVIARIVKSIVNLVSDRAMMTGS